MFVRIEFMYGGPRGLATDTYVREFPYHTLAYAFEQLAREPFPVTEEGADPDKYIWPSAIISVSVCDELGYTKHFKERVRNKDF